MTAANFLVTGERDRDADNRKRLGQNTAQVDSLGYLRQPAFR